MSVPTTTNDLDALKLEEDEPKAPTCVVCGEPPAAGSKLLCCTICKDVNTSYRVCSKACQVADWKHHNQTECLPVRNQSAPPQPLAFRVLTPEFRKPPVKTNKKKTKKRSKNEETGEPLRLCFVCKKNCTQKVYRCRACCDLNKDYWLCSTECQLKDWERHKNSECLLRPYKKKLDKGYEWYLERIQGGRKDEDAGQDEDVDTSSGETKHITIMTKRQFFRKAHAIFQDWDEKILYEHGFVYWPFGDRSKTNILGVQFVHPCDMITNWILFKKMGGLPAFFAKELVKTFETNMFDGLSKEQIDFIWDNRDFFWYGYHDIGSKRPILHKPHHPDNAKIYKTPEFKKLQQQKFQKSTKEHLEDFQFWIARSAGVYKKKKQSSIHTTFESDGSIMDLASGQIFQKEG